MTLSTIALLSDEAHAQPVSELPRTEYYVAKELYGAGRIAEAAEGFGVALNRARKVGQQRWVDSIPPLVMLGECNYQQGNLAAALEQYDAALILLHDNANWINMLTFGPERLPALDGSVKGIDWFTRSKPSTSVAVPEAIQLSVDPFQAQPLPGGGIAAPVNLISRLDASEVMRTLGMAMLRRYQILGPLAKFSPLAEPIAQDFSRRPNTLKPWVQASWSVLAGISQMSTATQADAAVALRQGVLIGGQFDYFMSPLALLALAELEGKQGNYGDAITALQDASLFSAFFEQHAEMSQALQQLGALGSAMQRVEMLPALQRATAWSNKKSLLAFSAGSVSSAELAIYARQFPLAERINAQAAASLRADVQLPRVLAQLDFNSALVAFAQDKKALAVPKLHSALSRMRGNAQSGSPVESVFQTQMTLTLLGSNRISATEAEQILDVLLAEPTRHDWFNSPIKTLAALTTVSQPAYERYLELAKLRGDDEQIFLRMDRLQRQRLYEALPLGGRLLSWRMGLQDVPTDPRAQVAIQRATQRTPELIATRDRVKSLAENLKRGPMPLDERNLPDDLKKASLELGRVAATHENLLAFQALLRQDLPRIAPGGIALSDIRSKLGDEDLLLAFAATNQAVFALAATKQQIAMWQIVDPHILNDLISELELKLD
ncbi:MAG: hypothetical protein AAF483_08870 [Planctomycetota bacterium]